MKKIFITLFCVLFSVTIQAQKTRITSSKSWKTVSSLMGLTFESAQSTLKTNGMKVNTTSEDKALGQTYYGFIPSNSTDPEYETMYTLICVSNKVVAIAIMYAYEENELTTVFSTDQQTIVDGISSAGFVLNTAKSKNNIRAFDNSAFSYHVELNSDEEMAYYTLILGADKYLALFKQ